MVLWMAFLGNLLVVIGLAISALVALRGMQIDLFRLGQQNAQTKESVALLNTYDRNYAEFFAKMTPFMIRTFWFGVATTVIGNVLMLTAATLELFILPAP